MKKKKTTKNPYVSPKLRRRYQIYSSLDSRNFLTKLTGAEIGTIRELGLQNCPDDEYSPWEIDPISNAQGREGRQLVVDALKEDGMPLYLLYAAHRAFTRSFVSSNDGVSSVDAAYDAVEELRRAVSRFSWYGAISLFSAKYHSPRICSRALGVLILSSSGG